MTVAAAIVAPHPPLLIPAVGKESLGQVKDTVTALAEVSSIVAQLAPETLVVISPHSTLAAASFLLRGEAKLGGSFAQFGHEEVKMEIDNDTELVNSIADSAGQSGLPVVVTDDCVEELDWGVLVPYYFLGAGRPIVSMSISALDYRDHFALGQAVTAAAKKLDRRVVFIASGDLSHRLTAESPYGYSPAGGDFDRMIVEIFNKGDLSDLMHLDPSLIENAAECGLKSFVTMAGAVSDRKMTAHVHSHEGPFGVGYAVASFVLAGEPDV